MEKEKIFGEIKNEEDPPLKRKEKKLREEILKIERYIKELEELANGDEDIREEVEKEIEEKKNEIKKLLEEISPKKNSCIVEIRAGVGGEEAALFAGDLMRMYIKFAERKGWVVKPAEIKRTDLGGVKEAVLIIEGENVFEIMRQEAGVHRVQRVPITESSGRIHTSTASVAVLEEPEEVEVEIKPEDLEIETFRASGPGGQYVNKTESAVRIKHIPTGIVVSCQEERSQAMNKAKALRILRAKLYERILKEREEELTRERKEQIGMSSRAEKIRTYNFTQNRVTDHRFQITIYKLKDVLDGNLDLIYNYKEK